MTYKYGSLMLFNILIVWLPEEPFGWTTCHMLMFIWLRPSGFHGESFDKTNTTVTSQLVQSSYFSYQHVAEYFISKVIKGLFSIMVCICRFPILRKTDINIIPVDFYSTWKVLDT